MARFSAAFKYRRKEDETREPAIVVNRRGDLVLCVVDIGDPFPEFHGGGGNAPAPGGIRAKRRRQGDMRARLRSIDSIKMRASKG
jgi:hypothetical protein